MIKQKNKKHALTLTEVVIASALGAQIALVIMLVFMQFARLNKSTTMQIVMSTGAHHMFERIEKDIRRACHVEVNEEGTTLILTIATDNGAGSYDYDTIYYRYLNPDENDYTIRDNRLVYGKGLPGDGNEKVILRYLSPLHIEEEEVGKLFKLETLNGPVVNINFRIGDSGIEPDRLEDAITGPGYQGVLVHTRAIPRNTQLYPH